MRRLLRAPTLAAGLAALVVAATAARAQEPTGAAATAEHHDRHRTAGGAVDAARGLLGGRVGDPSLGEPARLRRSGDAAAGGAGSGGGAHRLDDGVRQPRPARLEPGRGPDLRGRRAAQHRGGRRRRHLRAAARATSSGSRSTGARRRWPSARRRSAASCRSPPARRAPRVPRRAPRSARSGRCSATSQVGGASADCGSISARTSIRRKATIPFLYHPLPAFPAEMRAIRQNNDAFEGNGVLRLAVTLNGRRTLSLGAIGFGREQGLPGPLDNTSTTARYHSARGLGYLRYESRDDLGPGGRLSAQAFVSVERDRVIDRAGDIFGQGALIAHETTISTGVTAYATRPLGEWGRAAAIARSTTRDLHAGQRDRPDDVRRPRPAAGRGGRRRARSALAPLWTFTSFRRPASS